MGKTKTNYHQMFLVDSVLYKNNVENNVHRKENINVSLEPIELRRNLIMGNKAQRSQEMTEVYPLESNIEVKNRNFKDETIGKIEREYGIDRPENTSSVGFTSPSVNNEKAEETCMECEDSTETQTKGMNQNNPFIKNNYHQEAYPSQKSHNRFDNIYNPYIGRNVNNMNNRRLLSPSRLQTPHQSYNEVVPKKKRVTIPMQTNENNTLSIPYHSYNETDRLPLLQEKRIPLTMQIDEYNGVKQRNGNERDIGESNMEVIPIEKYENDIRVVEPIKKRTIASKQSRESNHKEERIIFICSLCNTNFEKKNALQRHMKNVHDAYFDSKKKGIKRKFSGLECKFCENTFSTKKALDRHVKNIHQDLFQNKRGVKRLLKQKKTTTKYMKYN